MKVWRGIMGALMCGLMLTSLSVPAQEKVAEQDGPKIGELLWMVGEWQAMDKSDDGSELVVRLSAKEAENHQAILFHVWFESKGHSTPKYEGMYYWNPAEKTYKLLQVNSDGNVAEGTYEQKGNRATELVKTVTGDTSFELKSDWEIRPREFHFVGQFRPAGKTEWVPAVEETYSRIGSLK